MKGGGQAWPVPAARSGGSGAARLAAATAVERLRALARLHAASVNSLRHDIAASLPGACGRALVLELGSGHGHFLSGYAETRPDVFCLGVDFCRDRVARARRKASRSKLRNLCFMHGEAFQFLEAWPEERKLAEVFVLFPDPWPKRRHRKNRIFCGRLLDRLAQVCDPAARLCFRTDSEDYFAEAARLLAARTDWREARESWPFERASVFQEKAGRFESLMAVRQ